MSLEYLRNSIQSKIADMFTTPKNITKIFSSVSQTAGR